MLLGKVEHLAFFIIAAGFASVVQFITATVNVVIVGIWSFIQCPVTATNLLVSVVLNAKATTLNLFNYFAILQYNLV